MGRHHHRSPGSSGAGPFSKRFLMLVSSEPDRRTHADSVRATVLALIGLLSAASTGADVQTPPPRSGEAIYQAACVTCHGPDGKGSALSVVGFDAPLPDFTDCAFATAEPDPDWQAVVHEGGPVRALDRHMPAFGDASRPSEIALAVSHLRTFCTEPAWPRGDLNLPRAFFTEKAFPENESVWATACPDGRRARRRQRADLRAANRRAQPGRARRRRSMFSGRWR